MLEFLIFAVVLFFIAVLFYKQANEQFEILQLEGERLEDLPTLYGDRSPIVVRDFRVPNLGNATELAKRTPLMNMMMAPNLTMGALLKSEGSLRNWTFTDETARYLSKESGLDVWFEHHLYTSLLPSPYTSWMYTYNTSLWPDHRGLFKTTAFQTLIMPTQGVAKVSLLLPKMAAYLPTDWQGRRFSSLTPADTPLLGQLQFLDVKLRRGNFLLLPAHLIVDISTDFEAEGKGEAEASAWCFVAELHHPISRIAGSRG